MQNWERIEKFREHLQPLMDEVVVANQDADARRISGDILNAAVSFRRFGCSAMNGSVCIDCLDTKKTVGMAVCEWLVINPLESSSQNLSTAGISSNE